MIRYLVDAQLPVRLARSLRDAGLDVVHTSELPLGNATPDEEINRISLSDHRVVVTKDSDFVQTFVRYGRPYKLLVISTGNMSNVELLDLFDRYIAEISRLFATHSYIELNRTLLLLHQ